MQIWNCTIDDKLKKLIDTTCTNKIYLLFSCLSLKNFTFKCDWLIIVIGWVTLWDVFPKNMWVRTKHAKKSCIDLWEQLLILEAIEADYQSLGKSYKEVVWSVLTNNEVLSREVS